MVIKVYTSGISGNKEMKKRQQRILMVLESKNIKYVTIDITEPGNEGEKQFMQEHAEAKDSKHPLPPQIFNEDDYCGDYVGFDLANENDELEIFLKMPIPSVPKPIINGTPKIPEESVHGFCYTPSLAKRLEKAIKATLTKKKPPPPPVRAFCYTPSLAQRLAKAIMKSHKQKSPEPEPVQVDEEEMEEQQELDSSLKDEEMEKETKLDEDEMEDGAEGEE